MISSQSLPQSESTENAIIGALLLEPAVYVKISGLITSQAFHSRLNGQIFEIIEELFSRNEKIDILTVHAKAKQKAVNISVYQLTQYSSGIGGTHHIETHAAIVRENWIKRVLISRLENILLNCYDNSMLLDDILDKIIKLTDALLDSSAIQNRIKTFAENLDEAIKELSSRQKIEVVNGFRSGIKSLRVLVPRFKPGQLIIIAGRPGMGKTGLMLSESFDLCKEGNPVLIISIEMTSQELTMRLIQRETDLTEYHLEGRISAPDWHLIDKSCQRLKYLGYFIDDSPGINIAAIKAKAKILKKTENIKAIFIDYLQLIRTNKKIPREQQVAETTAELKIMAKELELPIFLLCQLNREAEHRKESGYKPKLSDLRESGAIEQDADIVLFPYRSEYYFPGDIELKGMGEIVVAKNRGGRTGEAIVKINETVTKFEDIKKENLVNKAPF